MPPASGRLALSFSDCRIYLGFGRSRRPRGSNYPSCSPRSLGFLSCDRSCHARACRPRGRGHLGAARCARPRCLGTERDRVWIVVERDCGRSIARPADRASPGSGARPSRNQWCLCHSRSRRHRPRPDQQPGWGAGSCSASTGSTPRRAWSLIRRSCSARFRAASGDEPSRC